VIPELLPGIEHRMCARHIYAVWAKKWRGTELKMQFWTCAKATFEADLDYELKKLNKLGNGSVAELLETPPHTWCRAYFSTRCKCDVVDNNMAETFNAWILEARQKPIISMLEDIRVMVMNRMGEKRRFGSNGWVNHIAPRVMDKVEKYKVESFKCQLQWNGADGYEITHNEDRHVVNLSNKTCSCRAWDLTGIPCPHAICAIYHSRQNPEDVVDDYYHNSTYMQSYQFSLQPVRGEKMWPNTGMSEVLPPIVRRMPGRPKKLRRREKDEPKKGKKLSRKGTKMTCQTCGQVGHNKKGCSSRKVNTILYTF
jgi:hypothetical protein